MHAYIYAYIHIYREVIDRCMKNDRKIGRQAYLKAHRKTPKAPFL